MATKARQEKLKLPAELSEKLVIGPKSYSGETPEAMYEFLKNGIDEADSTQKAIQEYLDQPIEIPEIPAEWAALNPIMRPETHDFLDDKLLDKPGIRLPRMADQDIVALGRAAIPQIASGFSRQGAAAIFLLAYHLKRPKVKYAEEYVLDGYEALETLADKNIEEFSDRMMSKCGNLETIIIGQENAEKKEAAIYSFIAASLLRLFTKPPSNYTKAWNHILKGFSRFYGDAIDTRLPVPNEQAIKSLANWFSLEPRAKVTLFRLLYISNTDEEFFGLKSFLYDIHLSNTGMHIVSIMVELCKLTGATTGLLLTLINEGETERQVRCLISVLKLMQDTSGLHKRRMWKYGRIFDDTFLTGIQTKSCPKLVYILAAALKLLAPSTHKGILNIAQLADVSKENQEKCEAAAKLLLRTIKTYQAQFNK